jgi:tetratricopeptide (TPR) repeat protein
VEIMKKFTPSKLLILVAFMTGAFFMAACSPSAEKLINQGNEAFAKEEYLVALHEYQSAQVQSPELAEPYYNAANALYREGAYTEALEQMQLALQNVDDETLAENSIYNLGNNFYNTQELDQAIESYINALLLDPDDQDAKYNLELSLQQQQEQKQQEQEKQDQEQDQSESSEHQDEEQQSEEKQSQNSGNQDQEQQEQDQENGSAQGSGEQNPENEDPQKEEQKNQGQNNESGQPQESQEQSDQQEQPVELPAGQRMTEEQARQLLEVLAQDMDTLQERLGQILRVQIPPPVQDW